MDDFKLEVAPGAAEPALSPGLAANDAASAAAQPGEQEAGLTLAALSPEEQKMVLDFTQKIDVTDTNLVMQYGAASQNKIAQFSQSVLDNVKTQDLGEVGKMLSDLVVEVKNFDAGEEKGGFMGLFGGIKKSMDRMVASYSKVEVNIDKISQNLENHRRTLLKDVTVLDAMYNNNLQYYKELTLYIIAGKEKLREVNETTIPELRAKAEASGDQMDAQRVKDMVEFANRFDKKLHDLILSRMISIQMGPQIRLIQNNDTMLVDKIQSSLMNSIPLWKNQMVIALGLSRAQSALTAQKQVTDMTNELLQKNSALLKQGTVDIAKESERGIVSMDTIRKTNADLIETINSVLDIQQQGSAERRQAEIELGKIEGELKNALLSAKNR